MSKTLYFGNKGVFDLRAMLTFGVSAKEGDDAIGYFGTGFKYAVAIILRCGGIVRVHTGNDVFEFTKSRETIRGKEFEIVKVNGVDAGFTTRLGINWQPWMAFRELWCNCKDEAGFVSESKPHCDTVVEVKCKEVAEAYDDRASYFIEGTPDVSTEQCDLYSRPSKFVFYRGIAVQNTGAPAAFTYNIKSTVDLTEDRTAKYNFQISVPIMRAVQSLNNPPMLRKILSAPRDTYEHEMSFSESYFVSPEFIDTVRTLVNVGVDCNESARNAVSKLDSKAGNWPETDLSAVQHKMLDKACAVLRSISIDPSQFQLKIVTGLGDGVMGRAIDGTMYISLLPFNMGTKQVASTIMEEWIHCKHGFADFDRGMQNWLFDKILSLSEEISGDPI